MANEDRRFREVNSYAAMRGFGAGFPNFHQTNYGYGVVCGTILLTPGRFDFQDVDSTEYGSAVTSDVPEMMRAAHDLAARLGYAAAFPTFHRGAGPNGPVYGTVLLPASSVEFRDVPKADMRNADINDVDDMFTAANDCAVAQGYPGGFPTFHSVNTPYGILYGLQLLLPGAASWRDVPREELALFSRARMPCAIVLCTFRDLPPAPQPPAFYERFFTEAGQGTMGALDYWRDISYGGIDISGSTVFGWFVLNHDLTELEVPVDPNDPNGPRQLPPENSYRRKVYDWGLDAARRGGARVDDFDYKIVVCPGGGHGAVPKGVAIAFSPPEWLPGFACHEMGHMFGLAHSRVDGRNTSCDPANDMTPGAYCDQWDIMSWAFVFAFDTGGGLGGPSANAPNRLKLECLPDARIWKPTSLHFFNELIALAALERPEVDAWLAVHIPVTSQIFSTIPPSSEAFMIEYREDDRWDRGIPWPTVLLHRVDNRGRPLLVEGADQRADNLTGDPFSIPGTGVKVRVEAIDPATHTATLRIWNTPFPVPSPIRIATIVYNPPGADMPAERVEIDNGTGAPVELFRWTLEDLAGHVYEFPRFLLGAGQRVSVWTRAGSDDAANLFMGRGVPIWNNRGDTAILKNVRRFEVSRFVYR